MLKLAKNNIDQVNMHNQFYFEDVSKDHLLLLIDGHDS